MNYILCDPVNIEKYFPFALTRPHCEMRVFGGTIKEKWEKLLDCKVSYLTRSHLSKLYPVNWKVGKNIIIFSDSPIDLDLAKTYEFNVTQKDIDSKKMHFSQENFFSGRIKEDFRNNVIYNSCETLLSSFFSFSNDLKSNVNCSKNPFLVI